MKAKGTRVDRGAATTPKNEHERCYSAALSKQGTKSSNDRNCSAQRKGNALFFWLFARAQAMRRGFAVVGSTFASPSSIVAHPRRVCLRCLRCARCGCDKNLMRLGGKGMQAYLTMRRKYASRSSCRHTSPWRLRHAGNRRYHHTTRERPEAQRRRRKAAARVLLHIRAKERPQPWEKPRFRRRSTRSVSNFATENVR